MHYKRGVSLQITRLEIIRTFTLFKKFIITVTKRHHKHDSVSLSNFSAHNLYMCKMTFLQQK